MPMMITDDTPPMNVAVHSSSPTSTILPEYVLSYQTSQCSSPPLYTRHIRPEVPLTYTFSTWGPSTNSTILSPPENLHAPSYRISVSMNLSPFLPVSYVTHVEMLGLDEEQYFVGEFELSLHQTRGILTMGDVSTRLSNVITSVDQSRNHFRWKIGNIDLLWDCGSVLDDGSPMCICFAGSSKEQMATFVPPPILASPPLPQAVLTVFPDGHEYFEHILLSTLVVQRILTRDA